MVTCWNLMCAGVSGYFWSSTVLGRHQQRRNNPRSEQLAQREQGKHSFARQRSYRRWACPGHFPCRCPTWQKPAASQFSRCSQFSRRRTAFEFPIQVTLPATLRFQGRACCMGQALWDGSRITLTKGQISMFGHETSHRPGESLRRSSRLHGKRRKWLRMALWAFGGERLPADAWFIHVEKETGMWVWRLRRRWARSLCSKHVSRLCCLYLGRPRVWHLPPSWLYLLRQWCRCLPFVLHETDEDL